MTVIGNPWKCIVTLAGRGLAFLALILWSVASAAQTTPAGLWRIIDDATGKAKALVRIVETTGVLSGRIEHLFDPDPKWDGRCDRCRDDRKDQPVLGMTILTGARKDGDGYKDGEILDPENGNVYRCVLRLTGNGDRLEVRGFIGFALFGRTQIWLRER